MCDVGSGVGTVSLQLAKTYPTLQLKLQDLPHVILQAKNEVWPKEFPEAIKEGRLLRRLVVHNRDSQTSIMLTLAHLAEIGRASCRERVFLSV